MTAPRAGDPIPDGSEHHDRSDARNFCLTPGRATHSNDSGTPARGARVICTRALGHDGQHEAAGVARLLAVWPS